MTNFTWWEKFFFFLCVAFKQFVVLVLLIVEKFHIIWDMTLCCVYKWETSLTLQADFARLSYTQFKS